MAWRFVYVCYGWHQIDLCVHLCDSFSCIFVRVGNKIKLKLSSLASFSLLNDFNLMGLVLFCFVFHSFFFSFFHFRSSVAFISFYCWQQFVASSAFLNHFKWEIKNNFLVLHLKKSSTSMSTSRASQI